MERRQLYDAGTFTTCEIVWYDKYNTNIEDRTQTMKQ